MQIGNSMSFSYQRAAELPKMEPPRLEPPRTEPIETLVDYEPVRGIQNSPKLEPGFAFPDSPIDMQPIYTLDLSNKIPGPDSAMPTSTPKNAPATSISDSEKGSPVEPREPCHTCENRKYVDKSDDGGVSYQAPTKISSSVAAARVMAHEREHVYNERADADREGAKVINQSVALKYGCCPDCGTMYVAGGVTRTTTTKEAASSYGSFKSDAGNGAGEKISMSV